jgi:hypothetical protein
MIRPHKNLDLHSCVLRVAGSLVQMLVAEEAVKLDSARERIEAELGRIGRHNFMAATYVLYLLDIASYDDVSDALFLTASISPTNEV